MITRICPEDIVVRKLFVFKSILDSKLVCNLFLGEQKIYIGEHQVKYAPRWKARGNAIPFPVFSGTWFVGLPADAIIEYMRSCNYKLISITALGDLPTPQAYAAAIDDSHGY